MKNTLLERLRAKDKKGLFNPTQTAVSYPTGFTPFDFRNGYKVQARDMEDKLINEYYSLGLVGGSFVTVIGKSGTAKTTWCIQSAFNIVKKFDAGMVVHYDLEKALSYTRIKAVTKATNQQLDQKYILKQERLYIEDIFDSILEIYKEKMDAKKEFSYDSGLLDEFGRPINPLAPTVIILDSIPSMISRDLKDEEMTGQTEAMRTAKAMKQFYIKLLPIVKDGNFIILTINHINTKVEVNPLAKTQPQVMYLKMDEALPGGNAPIYYANNLLKFVSRDKFNMEDDGFDGFAVRVELLKSRTNKANQSALLVYDQSTGFENARSLFEIAKENKLVEGRNPYRYFTTFPDVKFSTKELMKEWYTNESFRDALMGTCEPILSMMLDTNTGDDFNNDISNDDLMKVFQAD